MKFILTPLLASGVGIYHFPVVTKQGSISFSHSEADVDLTLEPTDSALHELTRGAKTISTAS